MTTNYCQNCFALAEVRTSKNIQLFRKSPKVQLHSHSLKAHCFGTDWINKTIKNKRIRQGSVISLYSEIHEYDNDLIPFILESKYDPRA